MVRVDVRHPPAGFHVKQVSRGDPVPTGALPAVDTSGCAVKRCYYVPDGAVPQQHHAPIQQPHVDHGRSANGWADVLQSGHTFQTPIKLEFKEEMAAFSDGDAKVTDMNTGKVMFKVKGAKFSSTRRHINDGHGHAVCSVGRGNTIDVKSMIKKELGLKKSSRHIYNLHNQSIASVAEKVMKLGAASALTMADGRVVDLDANFRAKTFKANYNGQNLFTIDHKTSAKSLLLGKDTYHISIQPGVDAALAVATCLILEDLFRGENNEGGGGGLFGL